MDMPLMSPLMKYVIIYFSIFFIVLFSICLFLRNKFSWRIWIGVLPLPLLLIIYITFYLLCNLSGRKELEAQLEKMRQSGIPTDFKEFIPANIDSSDNAAILYKKAAGIINGNARQLDRLMSKNDYSHKIWNWSEADRNQAVKILSSPESLEFINIINEAVKKPFAAYQRNYNEIIVPYPEMDEVRKLFFYSSISASVYAFQGDYDKAYSIINNGILIIKQSEHEPLGPPLAYDISLCTRNIYILASLIKKYGISNFNAHKILNSLDLIDFNKAAIYTVKADLNQAKTLILAIIKGSLKEETGWNIYITTQLLPYRYLDCKYFLEYACRTIDLFNKPYKEAMAEKDKMGYELINNKLSHISMALASYGVLMVSVAEGETNINAVKITLALHIYKNHHGQFPETLNVLVPEILKKLPVDPITGKPFDYKKEGDYFSLLRKVDNKTRTYPQKEIEL